MTKKTNDPFEKLAEFLIHDTETFETSTEGQKRMANSIDAILARAEKVSRKDWIAAASAGRVDFEKQRKVVVQNLIVQYGSREKMVEAIRLGNLGKGAQSLFHLHHRNRRTSELTEEEIAALIEDQEAIRLLSEMKNKK